MFEHEFEYIKPKGLHETLDLLLKRDNYSLLAGGTDLVGFIKEGRSTPKVVIDIKGIKELHGIEQKSDELKIGALVTFTEVMESRAIRELFPVFREMALKVASPGIRNRATMVGNICSAVPCMDSGAPLYVFEAKINLKSLKGERSVPIEEWFLSPRKTSILKGELVTSISLPIYKKHSAVYMKLGRYAGEDLAQASVAVVALPNNQYRVAFGAVGPTPIRSKKIEQMLSGKAISEKLIEQAMNLVPGEISPITDIRATKEYRTHMCKIMMKRALLEVGGKA